MSVIVLYEAWGLNVEGLCLGVVWSDWVYKLLWKERKAVEGGEYKDCWENLHKRIY